MPTFARLHYPGAIVHLITRFLNREFLLAGPVERHAYLARIPAVLRRTDWTPLAYALMSNHIHMVLLAGAAPPWQFYQPLHTSFASWLNRRFKRLGPALKGRPTTIYLPPERLPQLIAYVHNNPVRARLVGAAHESDWTSHRAWAGMDAPPPWLAVQSGLRMAGFDSAPAGRRAFQEFVLRHAVDHAAGAESESQDRAVRRRLRAYTDLPVEVSAEVYAAGASSPTQRIVRYAGTPPPPRWTGPLDALLTRVAAQRRIPVELLRSRSRRPEAVAARRLVIVTGVLLLRRRPFELAAALGISDAAVSQHLRHGDSFIDEAKQVESSIRTGAS